MLNNLLTIGKSALNTAQAWVSVTGDNIANADTEGYSRRYVVQKEAQAVHTYAGEVGLGSTAEQILRYFDKFLEDSYLSESTISSRWTEHDNIMETVESIFNESNTVGLSDTIDKFFNSWQKLALSPEDVSLRTSVLTYGQTLSDMFSSMTQSIKTIQEEMNISIDNAVTRVNEISKAIAQLNHDIAIAKSSPNFNPNSLYDQRDLLVEELASIVDVSTTESVEGKYHVQLTTGQPLVDGQNYYELSFSDPVRSSDDLLVASNRLTPESTFAGTVTYVGTDDFEYTLKFTDSTTFQVSLDGGKNWLSETYTVSTDPIKINDIEVTFSDTAGLVAGDSFDIVPKKALYWIEPTRGPENVTPQVSLTGADNTDRITGGKMTAYFGIRDDCCGRYLDELDALASSIIWEVNRLHSQGAGLNLLTSVQGQEEIYDSVALGTAQSGSEWYDKLQTGNINFYFYDTVTNEYLGTDKLSFSTSTTSESDNFDPSTHTLTDVLGALGALEVDINGSPENVFSVDYQNNKVALTVASGLNISFAFGEDTTGLLAALGLNTFFQGDSAATLALSTDLASDNTKISAGRVNGQYEVNEGDNTIATAIGALNTKDVEINTFWKQSTQSLPEYYAALVAIVGSDKLHSETNESYHRTLTEALYERKEGVSGVNLDEEMTNLVKYQSAYKAAAKLITTADEMIEVLLGLKQ